MQINSSQINSTAINAESIRGLALTAVFTCKTKVRVINSFNAHRLFSKTKSLLECDARFKSRSWISISESSKLVSDFKGYYGKSHASSTYLKSNVTASFKGVASFDQSSLSKSFMVSSATIKSELTSKLSVFSEIKSDFKSTLKYKSKEKVLSKPIFSSLFKVVGGGFLKFYSNLEISNKLIFYSSCKSTLFSNSLIDVYVSNNKFHTSLIFNSGFHVEYNYKVDFLLKSKTVERSKLLIKPLLKSSFRIPLELNSNIICSTNLNNSKLLSRNRFYLSIRLDNVLKSYFKELVYGSGDLKIDGRFNRNIFLSVKNSSNIKIEPNLNSENHTKSKTYSSIIVGLGGIAISIKDSLNSHLLIKPTFKDYLKLSSYVKSSYLSHDNFKFNYSVSPIVKSDLIVSQRFKQNKFYDFVDFSCGVSISAIFNKVENFKVYGGFYSSLGFINNFHFLNKSKINSASYISISQRLMAKYFISDSFNSSHLILSMVLNNVLGVSSKTSFDMLIGLTDPFVNTNSLFIENHTSNYFIAIAKEDT